MSRPSARRALLLAAAALVAAATLVHGFAARPAIHHGEAAPLEADGRRGAEAELAVDACLRLDARTLEGRVIALSLACSGGDGAKDVPASGEDASGENGEDTADAPEVDGGRDDEGEQGAGADGGAGDAADGGSAGGDDADAGSVPPRRPTAPSAPPRSPAAQATPTFPTADEVPDGDGEGSPWADALYDLFAPLLAPPRPTTPSPGTLPGAPSPHARCATVCDPLDLGGSPAHRDAERAGALPPRVGLLARALDAVDAYVRLRN